MTRFRWIQIAFVFVGVFYSWRLITVKPPERPPESEAGLIRASGGPGAGEGVSSTRVGKGHGRPTSRGVDAEEAWSEFSAKFGRELEAEFSNDGRLAAIRGRLGQGARIEGFRPEDREVAIRRASEILAGASRLIGVTGSAPLEQSGYRGDHLSAQVTFQEAIEGTAIAPFGTVVVRLGGSGELIGLESGYLPRPRIENRRSLGPEEAQSAAAAVFPKVGDGSDFQGATRPVLWAPFAQPPSDSSGVVVRHAYEVHVRGFDIVVDAADGRILSRRDRRNFKLALL